jgi:PAS domain S-box-containing protein
MARTAHAATKRIAQLRDRVQDLREELALERQDHAASEAGWIEQSQELELSRERYAELYGSAPIGLITLDRNGFILEANAATEWMLGTQLGKLQRMPLLAFVAPGQRRVLLGHLIRCRRSDGAEPVITELALAGETPQYIEIISTRESSRAVSKDICYRTALRDISDRKQAERLLRRSEEQYRLLFELNPSPMWICDENTFEFLDVNEAALRLYGWPREEFMKMKATQIRPAEDVPKFHEAIRGQRGSLVASVGEWRYLRKDGSEFIGSVAISSMRYRGLDARLVVVTDITDRKRAEEAVRKLNVELEIRVAERTKELQAAASSLKKSVVSLENEKKERRRLEQEIIEVSEMEQKRIGQDLHDDLGQQLAGIWFFAAALERNLRASSSPEADEAGKISAMLDKALALTRSLARGLQPVMPEAGGLMAALRELADRSANLFKVRCRFSCRRPVLVHDPATATHLYRIAQEAVTNAARHGRAKHIAILLSETADGLALSVNDDGRGLKKPAHGRDGMGIRTMHYRAEVLGGSLTFQRRPRGGTCVACTIPIEPKPPTGEHHYGKEKNNQPSAAEKENLHRGRSSAFPRRTGRNHPAAARPGRVRRGG